MANIRRNGVEVESDQFAASGWRGAKGGHAEKHYRAALSLKAAREHRIAVQRAIRVPHVVEAKAVKIVRPIKFG